MKRLPVLVLILMMLNTPVFAADEFGSMFSSETPLALQDDPSAQDADIESLLQIEPASGEEADTASPAEELEMPMQESAEEPESLIPAESSTETE